MVGFRLDNGRSVELKAEMECHKAAEGRERVKARSVVRQG